MRTIDRLRHRKSPTDTSTKRKRSLKLVRNSLARLGQVRRATRRAFHDPKEQTKQGFDQLSQGWAIGTPGWKKALAQDHARRALFPGIEKEQLRALKEARWSRRLEELMRAAKRTVQDARSSPNNAPRKISIARALRQSQGASVVWLAQALHMGKPSTTPNYLCAAPHHP